VFVKKLERLARIKVVELERERFFWNEEKVEHASFFVEHKASTWEELVLELLRVAHFIFPIWSITIGNRSLSGLTSLHLSGENVTYTQRITGHREVRWEIAESQKYQRVRWLSGQPNRW
jgi:hypothetical protein